jgi:hypothetical protein
LVTVGHKASKGLLVRLAAKDPVERRAHRALSGHKVPVLLGHKDPPDSKGLLERQLQEFRAALALKVCKAAQVQPGLAASAASKASKAR